MSWVPLPWCTSKSAIAIRLMPLLWAYLTAIAKLLNTQNPEEACALA